MDAVSILLVNATRQIAAIMNGPAIRTNNTKRLFVNQTTVQHPIPYAKTGKGLALRKR